MAEVRTYKGSFVIKLDIWDNQRAKNAPQRKWNPVDKVWHLEHSRPNALYIKDTFDHTEITDSAAITIGALTTRVSTEKFPESYQFHPDFPPMDHQMNALDDAWGKDAYALFFQMRLGKTYTAINLAFARYHHAQIDQLLVICPTPIKSVWKKEIGKFNTIDDHQVQILESGKKLAPWNLGVMHTLVVGVEALSLGGAYKHALSFAKQGTTMCVIDESSRIKNFKSKRTEKCVILGGNCDYRMILTGTPVTQGIHDLYSQFEFLDARIIGQKSFYTFRNRYMIMGGFEGRQIMGYKNAKQLIDLVEPYSSVVKTIEVYDLVESDPIPRVIQPSPEQKAHFIELKQLMVTAFGDEVLETKTILERMTRFQQINGGFFPFPNGKDNKGDTIWGSKPLKRNPKLDELENMLDEIGESSTIIWARYVPEIEAIATMLRKNGKEVRTFYGATSDEDREIAKEDFQAKKAQFFVGNQTVGGMGQELSAADVMIYYSNTFSYEDREQSMARWQAMIRKTGCLIIDLVLNTLIDKSIMLAQEKKGSMAAYVDKNIKALKKELT